MDVGYKLKAENPRKNANIVSKLFFWWMTGIIRKGVKNGLHLVDLYKTLDKDKSKLLGDKLEKNWKDEIIRAKLKDCTPSLLRALSKTFLLLYMMWGVSFFITFSLIRCLQPLVLARLIVLFKETKNEGVQLEMYLTSSILVTLTAMFVFFLHHTNFGLSIVGMRIRIAVSSLVYRKITRLNQKSLGEITAGQVVNLLSNDVSRFDDVVLSLHAIWVLPFQVVIITLCLWQDVQISALAGILAMVIIGLPIQGYLGKLSGQLRYIIAEKTDHRVKVMNEVISGIQVIKMYAWEKSFEKVIKKARSTEMTDITKSSYLRGIYASCMVFLERLTLCLTVICYVLLGNVITAEQVFSMAQFFNILQMAVAIHYPMAMSMGAETKISIKRLQAFLLLEERETSSVEKVKENKIEMTNVSASWTSAIPTLENITLQIPPGTLCAIIGPVGAGKSSLLQLLLGELPAKTGKIYLGGEISYSSQEPWLFSSTIRNNILFGQTYDRNWYRQVVDVCCLERDFDQFPDGDRAIVGERGVSLSGGQRARINLARAIYRKADVYLMDDPLSAVDTHVGRTLFDKCIYEHLRNKTRILVTHQLQYLRKVGLIIVINEGKIEAVGNFEDLSKSKLDFTKMLVDHEESNKPEPEKSMTIRSRSSSILSMSMSQISEPGEENHCNVNDEEMNDPNSSALKAYITSSKSKFLMTFTCLSMIVAQALCAGADYWVSFWTNQEQMRHSPYANLIDPTSDKTVVYHLKNDTHLPHVYKYTITNDGMAGNHTAGGLFDFVEDTDTVHKLLKTDYAMYFYGTLIALAIAMTLIRSFAFFKVCMMSSRNLHANMFHSLLKAPMRFFDTNPNGRILNRFSKDMGAIDETLPRVLLESVQITLVMCGSLVNIGVTNPYMIIAMVIFGAMFLKIRKWFVVIAKDIKHLESASKSPVFSHVSSTLNGIATIRASKVESTLIDEFDGHQDVHTSAWFLTITCTAFFGLWLDIICVSFTTCVSFSFVVLYTFSSVNGSSVGLALSQSLLLTGMLQYGMKATADVIQQLTSVERVLDYSKIDGEESLETSGDPLLSKNWPSKGRVEFRNLSLKYVADDPPVLNNLSFVVQPGEKIGIVGRTGAGKSSLISALFRLAPTEGTIFIDGVDTKTTRLSDLRRKISIIPQEPVLFSSTIRYNLDPFHEYKDDQLWKALDEVELKDAVPDLDFMLTEGGNNFSLGQKQLVCLARAVLRDNKILVLDEATANVDQRVKGSVQAWFISYLSERKQKTNISSIISDEIGLVVTKTDSFIQATIRKKFKECTVLTIAHRLNTIMDSDKVLVMSFGHMLEFDHPHVLLQSTHGAFHKMLLETGPSMMSKLEKIAGGAYTSKEIDSPE